VLFCVERRKAWRMLQSKAGIENKEYKAQRAILADVDAGKISREDFFARAEEMLKERLQSAAAEAPRPANPAPVVVAKAPTGVSETVSKSSESEAPAPAIPAPVVVARTVAVISETVTKSRESETSEVVMAIASQVTVETESDNESADWERSVRLRLMELDVDPGNDAGGGMSKRAGI
jgi:hypothetical protein